MQIKTTNTNLLKIALQSTWYKQEPLTFLQLSLLWPLSQIYRFLSFVHRNIYQIGILKSKKFKIPVVVVGNIVVGGGGKTPTVIALVQYFQTKGIQVGVISRGYGRISIETLEVNKDSKIPEVGDEPTVIHLAVNLTKLKTPVFVANKRIDAATKLLNTYPDTQIIISDDGLQHHELQHDLAITVFDDRGVGNGLLLPAGPLRELTVKAKNSIILHTGNNPVKLNNVLAPQYFARRELAKYAVRHDGSKVSLNDLKENKKLVAIAGIANPEAFFEMLRDSGLTLAKTIVLPDHYDFPYTLNRESDNKYNDFTFICTMKDAVKIWQVTPDALVVPLDFEPEPAFFTQVDTLLAGLKSSTSSTSN